MLRILSKAKKEILIGWSTTLKAAGLRDSEEDADFLERSAALDRLRDATFNFQQSIIDYCGHLQIMSERSETIENAFRQADTPHTQIGRITKFHVQSQLIENCVKPLQALLDRIDRAAQIQTKRYRNRELYISSDGFEKADRLEKYERYHVLFIRAADAILELAKPLFAQVWACEEYFFLGYLQEVRENIRQTEPLVILSANDYVEEDGIPGPAADGPEQWSAAPIIIEDGIPWEEASGDIPPPAPA
jgi:hypothetical protein